MTLSLERIPSPNSPLSRLDGRWRIGSLVPLAGVAALVQTLPAATAALAVAAAIALLARLPFRWWLRRIGYLAPFLLLCLIILPWCIRDPEPLWTWGPLALSSKGLKLALMICLKALAVVTIVLALLVSAPLHVTLHTAQQLRVPSLLVHLVLLTYRYAFLVTGELGRLRLALRVRGFHARSDLHSYRTIAHVGGTLLVRSHDRAERVGQAMRCRGFAGRFHSLTQFRTAPTDIVALAGALLTACLLIGVDVWLRGE